MRNMLKTLLVLALLVSAPVLANAQTNPVEELTGNVWMQSTDANKQSLIYGAECIITIEHYVAKEMTKKKAKGNTLSPFEKGWSKAFKGQSRTDIVNAVDKWYKDNTDKWDRPVFDVIWYELIAPKL